MSTTTPKNGRFERLSGRERQVIGLAAAGLLDKQIGQELDVSINTLRTYWARIREKVGEGSRPALVAAYVADHIESNVPDQLDPLAHDGWVMDAETRTILASDAINDDHGLERGVPHHALEYAGMTHPEDVDKVRDSVFAVADGLIDSVHLVFRMVTPKGIKLVNSTVCSIRDRGGKVSKVYGMRVQPLDCRPSHNPEVRVGHWEEEDYESECFTIDEDFARIFGARSAGRVHRSEINWQRHPEDSERAKRECEAAVAARQDRLITDVRQVLADGRVVWGRAERRFTYEPDGKVRILGTFSVFE